MQSWQGRSRTLNDFFVMMYLHLNSEYGQSQRTISSIEPGITIRDRPLIKLCIDDQVFLPIWIMI